MKLPNQFRVVLLLQLISLWSCGQPKPPPLEQDIYNDTGPVRLIFHVNESLLDRSIELREQRLRFRLPIGFYPGSRVAARMPWSQIADRRIAGFVSSIFQDSASHARCFIGKVDMGLADASTVFRNDTYRVMTVVNDRGVSFLQALQFDSREVRFAFLVGQDRDSTSCFRIDFLIAADRYDDTMARKIESSAGSFEHGGTY